MAACPQRIPDVLITVRTVRQNQPEHQRCRTRRLRFPCSRTSLYFPPPILVEERFSSHRVEGGCRGWIQEDQLGPQRSGVVRALRPNQDAPLESQAFPRPEPEPVLCEDVSFHTLQPFKEALLPEFADEGIGVSRRVSDWSRRTQVMGSGQRLELRVPVGKGHLLCVESWSLSPPSLTVLH